MLILWATACALALVLGIAALRLRPTASGAARARNDIAHGKPKYYYFSGVANAPPQPEAEAYRARGVDLVSTGCQPVSDEEAAYNQTIAEHYRHR
jgi:hypothetical protein